MIFAAFTGEKLKCMNYL